MAKPTLRERIASLEAGERAADVVQEAFWHLSRGDKPEATGEIDPGDGRTFTYALFGVDRARGGVVIIREVEAGTVVSSRAVQFDDLLALFGPTAESREAWWFCTRELLERFAAQRRELWRQPA